MIETVTIGKLLSLRNLSTNVNIILLIQYKSVGGDNMKKMAKVVVNFVNQLEMFPKGVLFYGLQLTCGLYALAFIFLIIAGMYGDYLTAINYSESLQKIAGTILTEVFIVTIICEVVCKSDKQKQ